MARQSLLNKKNMSYRLSQKEFARLKRRLTGRENKLKSAEAALRENPNVTPLKNAVVTEAKQLIHEVEYANAIFEDLGYPDAWTRWQRLKEDTQFLISRNS